MDKRKQLLIALAIALWLSVASWIAFINYNPLLGGFGEFLARVVTYCLPGVLFGGILLWYFRK